MRRSQVYRLWDGVRRACAAGAAVGFVPYLAVLWDFGVRPLRTATANGQNSNFFDLQATALLHGRLHVPAGSLGIEAFVIDGRHYMYFGPFPALLRLPVMLVTDRLEGRLTALSMLAGWLVLAAALTWMAGEVRRRVRGDDAVGRFEAIAIGAVIATVTGGSTILYLASQPWVFHEVYIWSTALTVATTTSLIVAWDDPTIRRVVVTLCLALATILTRAPAGWAMAFVVAATGAWFLVRRRRTPPWRSAGIGLVTAGLLTVLVGSAVNWAKFRHPYKFPIADQVWTAASAHRRLVLFHHDGAIDGPQFIWTTLTAYFRPDGVRFVPVFPFVTPPAHPQRPMWGVFLDESLRTGSVTALMPLLLMLTVWGLVVVFRPGGLPGVGSLRIAVAGTALMTYGVLAFGYVAQRYTSEFLPLLAIGAVVGVADIARRLESVGARRAVLQRAATTAVCVLAVYGMLANLAIAATNGRQSWRGDRLTDFVAVQAAVSRITGQPLDDVVHRVEALPAASRSDELYVVGDCDAVYIATGERSGPWAPVAFRERIVRVDVVAEPRPASVSLMWFAGHTVRRLHLQVGFDGRLRLVVLGVPPDQSGEWLEARPGDELTVTIHGDTAANQFVAVAAVDGTGATSRVDAPMTEWDRDLRTTQVVPAVAEGDPAIVERAGLRAQFTAGRQPGVCDDLL